MITDYSSLQSAVMALLMKPELEQVVPVAIQMAESELQKRLDTRQMVSIVTFNITGETAPVPPDFAGVKAFRLNTDPVQKLEYKKPDDFDDTFDYAQCAPNRPKYYTIVGNRFMFSAVPDATYQGRLRYRTRLVGLSVSNTCNWLLCDSPDAYLYGTLKHLTPYLEGDPRLPQWSALFEGVITAINHDDALQSFPATISSSGRKFG